MGTSWLWKRTMVEKNGESNPRTLQLFLDPFTLNIDGYDSHGSSLDSAIGFGAGAWLYTTLRVQG